MSQVEEYPSIVVATTTMINMSSCSQQPKRVSHAHAVELQNANCNRGGLTSVIENQDVMMKKMTRMEGFHSRSWGVA
jgi:hypothetical protein